jgi:beta-lactamase superfamily II metal-dependent hydrolase
MRLFGAIVLLFAGVSGLPAAKPMQAWLVDVEGGQATLIVAPSGESMLIDTGWSGHSGRDAARIMAAAKKAGVKRIDYLVITHYHEDHVGGVANLAERIPIRNFVDHGPNVETGRRPDELTRAYINFRDKGQHLQVKAGDTIPIKGLNVRVVSAGGNLISAPLEGAGAGNPQCAVAKPREKDATENAQSVGMLISFGNFRMLDLGDLTWNKEIEMMCPKTKLPPVDVYLVTHHGMNMSGTAAIVDPLHAQVALMNNGARKGGTAEAWKVIHDAPGMQDIWQLHYAVAAGKDANAPDSFIANTDEICEGKWLHLAVQPDGSFTVTNSRNKYTKTYKPRS